MYVGEATIVLWSGSSAFLQPVLSLQDTWDGDIFEAGLKQTLYLGHPSIAALQ